MLGKGCQTPLVSKVILIRVQVVLVLFVLLVDGVVGQVGEFGVLREGGFESLRGKPDQAFVVYVDSPRVHRSDADVDSKVELESIDEEWVRYIP